MTLATCKMYSMTTLFFPTSLLLCVIMEVCIGNICYGEIKLRERSSYIVMTISHIHYTPINIFNISDSLGSHLQRNM